MNDIIWSPGVKLEHVEKKIILKALAFYGNDRETTARSLGISRRTLDGRISDYKKDEPSQTSPDAPLTRTVQGLGGMNVKPTILQEVKSDDKIS